MTSLRTAILLTLTIVGGFACDSNPTPHPGNDAFRPDAGGNIGVGDAFHGELPPDHQDPDDLDPSVPSDENGTGEKCPDVIDGADAGFSNDASDDNNETSVGDATPSPESDCGDTEPEPGASSDHGKIQNKSGNKDERHSGRPSRARP